MMQYEKPRLLDIKNCPDVCARAKWYQDPMFPARITSAWTTSPRYKTAWFTAST